jgi:selenocysteine lyase/cysteine desulfurase
MKTLFENDFFNQLRNKEFDRLDKEHHVYLDYTGGNLYPKSLVEKHCADLQNSILGNPHSGNPSSMLSTERVESARAKVIEYFKADDYFCVFTQNASASLKIIGEGYPFSSESTFLLMADNHNSVNGIREFCSHKGGRVVYVPVQYEDLMINSENLKKHFAETKKSGANLFAFPAQSNVSGVKHDLSWIAEAQNQGFDVVLDAAAFVPTDELDLSRFKPNFVSVSFYKIFGFPTGIGCLLIRKDSFEKIQKPWFAGGTVSLVSVGVQKHFLQNNHERFEDGTLNYLHLPCIKDGLEFIESIGIQKIKSRVRSLAEYLYAELSALKHDNGVPMIQLFGPKTFDSRGGTLILNFFDQNGKVIDFQSIEKMANHKQISLRTGCFCNPGIDEINNCITDAELSKYYINRDENSGYKDMIETLGKMRGAVRISVGLGTNQADLDEFVEFCLGVKNVNSEAVFI